MNDQSKQGQRSVLVTGASSGIGRATAIEFARRGYLVFAAARREDALAELTGEVPGIRAIGMDVTDESSVARAWAKILAETGGSGVNVLVNNAGFALSGPVEVLAGDEVRRQFDTNVFGLLAVTRTVLPAMRARRSGRIINVSSVVGRTTFPVTGVYGATKYAVEALSDALRLEVAGFGVKVIIIEPGFVATGIGTAADAHREAEREIPAAYAGMVAAGNTYMARQVAKGISADRVAAAIVNAAGQRRPRARYAVPASARLAIGLLTALPDRLSDLLKHRMVPSS
jgi:NADP-dependent 3-hydroxy acid dehydrogenase YdfG